MASLGYLEGVLRASKGALSGIEGVLNGYPQDTFRSPRYIFSSIQDTFRHPQNRLGTRKTPSRYPNDAIGYRQYIDI